jgi:hypothetical protein
MKVIRVIQYEGPEEDVLRALDRALLTAQAVIRPGDVVPGVGPIAARKGAPQVTVSLLDQREERE